MTVLGEAFIEVRADMKPFIKDLDSTIEKAANAFEKRMRTALSKGLGGADLGDSLGDELGDGISKKIRGKLGDKKKQPWVTITAAFGSALDDGISALPSEIKTGIVGGIILATPLISGAISAALGTGIALGVAGLGTLLAFQFQEVQDAGILFADNMRLRFLGAASAFVPAVLRGLSMIEFRFEQLAPLLSRIFAKGAEYLEPLTRGALDFTEQLLSGVDDALGQSGGFVEEFSRGMRTLGYAIAEVLRILTGTGDAGRKSFRDLIFFTSLLLLNLAQMVAFLAQIYGMVRTIGEAAAFFTPLLGMFIQASDDASGAGAAFAFTNVEMMNSMAGAAKASAEEEKRLRDLTKAIDDASRATYGIIESQIAFEESIDNISAALKENGDTFDVTTEKGRENVTEFLRGLKAAEEETLNQIAIGKLNAQQAAQYYDQQIEKLRQLAVQGGFAASEFDTLYGNIIGVAQLKLDAAAMGITNTEAELSDATKQAAELYRQLQNIKAFRLPSQGTRRFSEYADGGIVRGPTEALIGEAGPEVVIPMTKPQRAAQLLAQSGMGMLLGGNGTVVYVYVGNEQLDARTYEIVEKNNNALTNSLAFGARGL